MYKYEQQIKEYWEKGYTELPNFFTESEIDSLSSEISKIIDSLDFNEHRRVFRTGKQQQGDDYFVNSGQNISFFFEEGAFDADGNLAVPRGQCLNKMGHALHELNPVFKSLTFDDRVKTLLKGLGHVKPHVVQGMINFKNPRIGTEYTPHRDAEFLYTEPEIKLTGFWVPLADVTVENGCLYFIPGSHKESVTRRFVRNKDDSGPRVSFNAPMDKYDDSKFVPVTAKKGSLLLIHGLVVHKSTANTSDKGRPAYTFHVVDLDGTKWAPDNWLQPTEKLPFSRVLLVKPMKGASLLGCFKLSVILCHKNSNMEGVSRSRIFKTLASLHGFYEQLFHGLAQEILCKLERTQIW